MEVPQGSLGETLSQAKAVSYRTFKFIAIYFATTPKSLLPRYLSPCCLGMSLLPRYLSPRLFLHPLRAKPIRSLLRALSLSFRCSSQLCFWVWVCTHFLSSHKCHPNSLLPQVYTPPSYYMSLSHAPSPTLPVVKLFL